MRSNGRLLCSGLRLLFTTAEYGEEAAPFALHNRMRMLYSESRFYRPEVEDSEDEGDYDGDELSETDDLLQVMD